MTPPDEVVGGARASGRGALPVRQTGVVAEFVRVTSDVVVGRDTELDAARRAVLRLGDGHPGVVLIAGEPGVGKSRLCERLSQLLAGTGVRTLAGACVQLESGEPPLAALISAFGAADPPPRGLIEALTGIDSLPRVRLFELIRNEVVELARPGPFILFLDDVHWCDRASRDVVRYLLAAAREGRWGLLCTYRPDEVDEGSTVGVWLDRLRRDMVLELRLEPFSVHDVRAQVEHITGEDLAPDVAAALHRRSGGVPLLVEELVAARRSGWPGVPGHVRDLMTARVRRLGETVTAVAELLAVADWSDVRTLTVASGLERAAVAEALDRATAAEVLRTDGVRYALRHDLQADAIRETLPAGRRRALHAALARAITETWPGDVAAQAIHWHEADEPAAAVRLGLAAADLAERIHAPAEAHRFLERVLSDLQGLAPGQVPGEASPGGPSDDPTRLGGRRRLLARAAEDAYLGGDFERAAELALEATAEAGTEPEDALVWERVARYRFVAGDGSGATDAYARALVAVSDATPAATRARVWAAYSWNATMTSVVGDAAAWARRALGAAEAAHGDRLARCRALLALGLTEDPPASIAAFEEALDLASEADAADEVGRALVGLALTLRRTRDSERLEAVVHRLLRTSQAYGMEHTYGAVGIYLRGELLIGAGRWDEAAEALDEGLRVGARGVPELFVRAHRARLAARRGEWDSATADAAAVRERSALLPQQPLPAVLADCAAAEVELWHARPGSALERLGSGRERVVDPVTLAEVAVLTARAEADVADAARLRPGEAPGRAPRVPKGAATSDGSSAARSPRERPGREAPPLATASAFVAAEGSRRAGERAAGLWRIALDAAEAAGDPYLMAYAGWRLGQVLATDRSGRREAARVVRGAHVAAKRLGAKPLQEAIETFARSARIRLAAGGPAPVFSLTPREQEVLERVAAGRTNAQIAEALGISPRTVGVHVSAVLRKLGAERRTEAADLARRRGLIDR